MCRGGRQGAWKVLRSVINVLEIKAKKKFETIEEIKQVSGIGEALFEKIKENITI